jgi:DNA replication and repair protein RecF
LIALKVAEFFYLQKVRSESPVLLLDDIFGELDAYRSERLLGLIRSLGQAFITSTNEAVFPADFDWGTRSRKFFVQQGAVV